MATHPVYQTFFNPICFVKLLFGQEPTINRVISLSQIKYLLAPFQTLFRSQSTTWTQVPEFPLILTIGINVFLCRCPVKCKFLGDVIRLIDRKFITRQPLP